MTYNSTAIVLRRRDHGEWDRLYTVLTREHGKLSLVAKGTRRPKAKLAAHLEPYAVIDLVAARGRTMDRVTFARTIRTSAPFAQSWEANILAAFCAEAVDQLTRDAHRDADVFDLLDTTLAEISKATVIARADGNRPAAIPSIEYDIIPPFLLRLCALLGYAPCMDACLECKGAPGPALASGIPDRGGFVCHQCRPSAAAGIPLTGEECASIAEYAAQFRTHPATENVTTFAHALLATHTWQPLRTSLALTGLTRVTPHATLAGS